MDGVPVEIVSHGVGDDELPIQFRVQPLGNPLLLDEPLVRTLLGLSPVQNQVPDYPVSYLPGVTSHNVP